MLTVIAARPILCLMLLMGLAACQQGLPSAGRALTTSTPVGLNASLPAPCADGLRAELTTGVQVEYAGSLPTNNQVCLVRWDGQDHSYYLGFWGSGRLRDAASEDAPDIQGVLAGPVGTEATFPLHRDGGLWRTATITHVADGAVQVGGEKRAAVELRAVRHEDSGAPGANAESLYWIDRETGIILRQQIVTAMADGERQQMTIWQVRKIVEPRPA